MMTERLTTDDFIARLHICLFRDPARLPLSVRSSLTGEKWRDDSRVPSEDSLGGFIILSRGNVTQSTNCTFAGMWRLLKRAGERFGQLVGARVGLLGAFGNIAEPS
jgi:hypothetical protein